MKNIVILPKRYNRHVCIAIYTFHCLNIIQTMCIVHHTLYTVLCIHSILIRHTFMRIERSALLPYILLTKIAAAQNVIAHIYRRVRRLYLLAVIFAAAIVVKQTNI